MDKHLILNDLNEEGVYIFNKPFIPPDHVDRILDLADKYFLEEKSGAYEFGKASRIGRYEEHHGNAIYELFSNDLIWELATAFYGLTPSFNEIFLTHDYTNKNGLARNGWLHYDRIPTLKFFMYLTDCDKDSGAFSYVPGSYKLGREMRKRANEATTEYNTIGNRLEIDFPELGYTKEKTVPVTGEAGTMFIFHSDLFHCGGLVADGAHERKIIRMHLRP